MRRRQSAKFCPGLERLEGKQLPSAVALPTHVANLEQGPRAVAHHRSEGLGSQSAASDARSNRARPNQHGRFAPSRPVRVLVRADQAGRASSNSGFTIFRITNTAFPLSVHLNPPFQQVLVQSRQPVTGRVYNVLSLAVRNGTAQTFDEGSHFAVRVSSNGSGASRSFPILTGDQQWKPGQFIVFYVLTKKYYPVSPEVSGGFEFSFAPGVTAKPGPSGIFLRVTYRPSTFARTLDWIVAHGPGAQGGKGAELGLPDTAIWEFVSSKTVLEPL
jgi:hypothetical protein